jgi:hypothetical protein
LNAGRGGSRPPATHRRGCRPHGRGTTVGARRWVRVVLDTNVVMVGEADYVVIGDADLLTSGATSEYRSSRPQRHGRCWGCRPNRPEVSGAASFLRAEKRTQGVRFSTQKDHSKQAARIFIPKGPSSRPGTIS